MENKLRDKIIEHVIVNTEGVKYTNIPGDKGGPTKFGITLNSYSLYLGRLATVDEIKNMTMDTAIKVYIKSYWNFYNIDSYPENIRHFVFDMYVNHSPKGTGKIIQTSLNKLGSKIPVDGVVGFVTFREILSVDSNKLLEKMIDERIRYYNRIVANDPVQSKFLKGWTNRANWFKNNKITVDGIQNIA